jgi:hypothetical protein
MAAKAKLRLAYEGEGEFLNPLQQLEASANRRGWTT